MEEEVRKRYESSSNYELPPLQKKFILFRIPPVMRFSIIWILFFSILGVALQSFQSQTFSFPDSIVQFFGTNFVDFINSFGNFTTVVTYEDTLNLVYSIVGKWYYFFYTGGLLAFLWSLISWIIHIEISFNKKMQIQKQIQRVESDPLKNSQVSELRNETYFQTLVRQQNEKENQKKQEQILTSNNTQNNPNIQRIALPIQERPLEQSNYLSTEKKEESTKSPNERVEQWLQVGLLLLSQNNLEEAEMIYNSLKQEYDFSNDPYQELYSRIKSFYEALIQKRSN